MCSAYGELYDVKYNPTKSVIIICQTKMDKSLKFPDCKISGNTLNVCDAVKGVLRGF